MKGKINRGYLGIIFLFTLSSCDPHELQPRAYMKWVSDEDHGLRVIRTINDYKFTLQYKPVSYRAIEETGTGILTGDQLAQYKEKNQGLDYFVLQIQPVKGSKSILNYDIVSQDEYYRRVEYFSFNMQQDLSLVAGNDTLPCVLYHFERNYGLAPYCSFVIAFEKRKPSSEAESVTRTLLYNDKLLSVGRVKMTIEAEAFSKLPQLKLN